MPGSCCSLASALSSVSDHGRIIQTVKRRFDEREEACAKFARAADEARVEKESRAQLNQAQSDRESNLREEVMVPEYKNSLADLGSVRDDLGPRSSIALVKHAFRIMPYCCARIRWLATAYDTINYCRSTI